MARVIMAICGAILLAGSVAHAEPSKAGRAVVAQAPSPTFCPEVELPVCGIKDGRRVQYGNECKAKRDGASNISPGSC